MKYPGYLLNPGDLFQVRPELVMYATGAPKDKLERRKARLQKRKKATESEPGGEPEQKEQTEQTEQTEQKEGKGEASDKATKSPGESSSGKDRDPRQTLKALLSQARNIMASSKDVLPAKRKQELRGFQQAIRRVLSRSEASTVLAGNLEEQFAELISLLKAKKAVGEKDPKKTTRHTKEQGTRGGREEAPPTAETSGETSEQLTEAFQAAARNPDGKLDAELTSELTDEEFDVLKRALVQIRDNPVDLSKPYATPWRPRDYMSAFAFIPRYLEVNQNICAAVYLRHPVARPGISEVPTPFNEDINRAAFAWYLRRR